MLAVKEDISGWSLVEVIELKSIYHCEAWRLRHPPIRVDADLGRERDPGWALLCVYLSTAERSGAAQGGPGSWEGRLGTWVCEAASASLTHFHVLAVGKAVSLRT